MRLVGYLRVTTDRQAEEGLGLEVQEEAIQAWAQTHGHELVALTRDEGISGSNGLDTRVGLGDALEAVREGRAEGLVVYRLDRLARDLIVQETLLAELRRMGARFSRPQRRSRGTSRTTPTTLPASSSVKS
jgi:DNA invertase Pin-like site-specific DNA recombinase